MIAQTKAELLKLRSTRTTLGLVLGMIALIVLFGLLAGLLTESAESRGAPRTSAACSVWGASPACSQRSPASCS